MVRRYAHLASTHLAEYADRLSGPAACHNQATIGNVVEFRKIEAPAHQGKFTMPYFYLTPKQDDSNQELQICIAEALYDVDSIVADPGAYTKEELVTLHSQVLSNLEQEWEITGRSEDELTAVMVQISQVVARQFNKQE